MVGRTPKLFQNLTMSTPEFLAIWRLLQVPMVSCVRFAHAVLSARLGVGKNGTRMAPEELVPAVLQVGLDATHWINMLDGVQFIGQRFASTRLIVLNFGLSTMAVLRSITATAAAITGTPQTLGALLSTINAPQLSSYASAHVALTPRLLVRHP